MLEQTKVFEKKDLVGHGWVVTKVLPFNDLYDRYRNHKRLSVFVEKGLKCVYPGCDRIGCLLVIAQSPKFLGTDKDQHVDLYTADMHLMTVDHIIPRSANGSEDMSNKQPMCSYHNGLKGSTIML